jgi:peptide/nickel transport system substrate-binding protein
MGIVDSTEARKRATTEDPWARAWLGKNHAGYGPYRIASWTDSEVTLEARPEYYRGKPAIQRAVIKQVPEASNRASLVEAGSADIVVDLPLSEIERIRGKPGLQIMDLPGNEHVFLGFNHRLAPLNDRRVRQAVGHAIPVDAILKNVYYGRARPLKTEWPDTYPGVTDRFYRYAYDVNRAKALLAEAGYPNGFKTTIIYPTIVPETEQIGIIIRQALAQIGIDVTLERVTGAEFSQRLFGPTKNTPAWINATSKPMTPAIEYMLPIGWLCTIGINASGYCNQQVDQYYQELLAETKFVKRRAIYVVIQKLIAEDAHIVGLAQWGHHVAVRSSVTGYGWYTDGRLRLFDLRKE